MMKQGGHEGEAMRSTKQAGLFGSGGRAVPLRGVEVRAEIVAGHTRVVLRQRYQNDEARAIEAIYTFPLPTRGAVTGFAMKVNGRQLLGEVHEREEAFRRYDEALSAGHGGALLEQERPNVFTANVGNLLPGEETIIEVTYVEPLRSDEGAIRWSLPTLVAPRYVPGAPMGDRTAHGTSDPTPRVPDADRISPPIADVSYGLALDLDIDLGCDVDVESPSHAIRVERRGSRTHVTFAGSEVALDRDLIITAFPKSSASAAAPLTSVVAHRDRSAGSPVGTFAVTLVPDLAGGLQKRGTRSEVVFLLDRSGSMGGASITEARTALRLCLRQLREGDRFAILAFDDAIEPFAPEMTTLTPSTLRGADAWLETVDARGGTEMLEPLLRATALAPSGVVVLLTDGQIANEDEILKQVVAARRTARFYSFGIGTNVSDALLIGLADQSGGAVEMIHPGERVDEKVVAQFARATAPRITDLKLTFRGVDVGELAPAEPLALVDGEPFTIFGTYESPGIGALEIRGLHDGEKIFLEVPLDLPESEQRPSLPKLWAQARIRELEHASLSGRRADAMKDRIIKLAKEHGVSSRYTSFVVVEKRTGDRRVNEQAETRVVPVNAPADWAMFKAKGARSRSYGVAGGAPPPAMAGAFGGRPPPRPAAGMPPPMRAMSAPAMARAPAPPGAGSGGPPVARSPRVMDVDSLQAPRSVAPAPMAAPAFAPAREEQATLDPVTAVLGRQSSSGLWEAKGRDAVAVTTEALLALMRAGITSSHPVHGAQTRKGADALLEALVAGGGSSAAERELALAVLWLVSTGRRTRLAIKEAAARLGVTAALEAAFARDEDVRAHVERLAPP